MLSFHSLVLAGIAQSVQRPATSWTVREWNPGGGRDFLHASRPDLGTMQPRFLWVLSLCPGGKAAGAWIKQPPPYTAKVKEKVDLNLQSTRSLNGLF